MLKTCFSIVLVGVLSLLGVRPAHAQFAVIDVASLAQLIQEYETLQQELSTAQTTLSQAQSAYAAITGNRGMQNLLSGTVRNYLPADWTQLSQVMTGSSSTYPALAASVSGFVNANAVLSPTQIAGLSPSEQAQLAAARQNPALLAATARSALTNASNRFAELQQLVNAIGSAADEKASLDLTARITAEQGMLQNEATKLQMLYQVAQSQEWARAQRAREQALSDQGSLRTLPALGL
jgi:type IV secretion system protein VirB5